MPDVNPPPEPDIELTEEDFYLEDGNLVFTAAYHLKRGYCCGSKCRHCPYADWGQPPPPAAG